MTAKSKEQLKGTLLFIYRIVVVISIPGFAYLTELHNNNAEKERGELQKIITDLTDKVEGVSKQVKEIDVKFEDRKKLVDKNILGLNEDVLKLNNIDRNQDLALYKINYRLGIH